MNTPRRNSMLWKNMKTFGKVYSESEEDKQREQQINPALENATREYPLPTARKFAWILCGGFWLFCLGGLLFGAFDAMRALFPFLFFSLAIVSSLHVPVFFVKRKMFDVIIGIVFAVSCIGVGLSMLVSYSGGV